MSKGVTGPRQAEAQDLKVVSTIQEADLGAEIRDSDGNVFRYILNGATQADHGKLQVAEAVAANHTNQNVLLAGAVGDRQLTLTLGATAATADQYREGSVVINSGTGVGYQYEISGHYAANSGATLVVYLTEPLAATTAVGAKYSLVKNLCKSVIQSTTLSKAVGVPLVDIPANQYGWVMARGTMPVLAQGAVTKGFAVKQDNATTAGAVIVAAAATDQVIGCAPEALVSTEYRQVTLAIDK